MKTKTDNVYCTEEIEPAIWLSNDLETVISKNYQKGVEILARKLAFYQNSSTKTHWKIDEKLLSSSRDWLVDLFEVLI